MVGFPDGTHTLQNHSSDTKDDQPQEKYIKGFSGTGFRTKQDGKYSASEIHSNSSLRKVH
jgi:hypothetical protein